MTRTVIADGNIEKSILKISEKNAFSVGLIIGQLTSQRDYAIHVVATPPNDSSKAAKTLYDVSDKWVAGHAQQVMRMLPGGLDIIGVFLIAQPDAIQNVQTKLRQMLFAVHKSLTKNQIIPVKSEYNDKIALQICQTSKKTVCRTFDVTDPKCSAKPADWKTQSFLDRWYQIEASILLDNFPIVVPQERLTQGFDKQLQTGVTGYCNRVWNAIGTINGRIEDSDKSLDSLGGTASMKPSKGKQKSASVQRHRVDLLVKLPRTHSAPQVTDCGAEMLVRGTMACRAYLHSKATVNEAVQAIKTDAIRSFSSRCDLLCEEVMETEDDQDPKVVYETPLRAFVKHRDTDLTFCDYLFQSELDNSQDMIERLSEFLGIEVSEDMIEKTLEHMPMDDDLLKPGADKPSLEDEIQDMLGMGPQAKSGVKKHIGALASAVVAMVAVGVSYWFVNGG